LQFILAALLATLTDAAKHLLPVRTDACEGQLTVRFLMSAYELSSQSGITLKRILELNRHVHAYYNTLFVDQRLCISNNLFDPNCDNVVLVGRSDTCESLSTQAGISQEELQSMNPTLTCSEELKIGRGVCLALFNDFPDDVPTVEEIVANTVQLERAKLLPAPRPKKNTRTGPNITVSSPIDPPLLPGICTTLYMAQGNDTCASLTAQYNITNFEGLNPTVCCTNRTLKVMRLESSDPSDMAAVCLQGTPYLPQVISQIRHQMSNVSSIHYCPTLSQSSNSTQIPLANSTAVDPVDTTKTPVPLKEPSKNASKETLKPKNILKPKEEPPAPPVPKKVTAARPPPLPKAPKIHQSEPARPASPPKAAPKHFGGGTADSSAYVREHNRCRANAGVGPISWDSNVASRAQAYANTLAGQCSRDPQHSPQSDENLFYGPVGSIDKSNVAKLAIYYWCDMEPLSRSIFNHHRQVAYSKVSVIGCGYAECGSMQYVVCKYNPKVGMEM